MKSVLLSLLLSCTALVSRAETGVVYRTTGPIVSFDEKTVTIQKGKAQWTFDRGPELSGPLSIGTLVTINYHMVADSMLAAEPKPTPAPTTPATKTKDKKTDGSSKTKTKTPSTTKPSTSKTPAKKTTKPKEATTKPKEP